MDRKYNILYTSSYSMMRGGGQRSMYLLIKHLDRSRYIPFLVVPDEGELAEEVKKLNVKVYAIFFPRVRSLNIFKVITALLKIMVCIRSNSIDLIHVDAPREALFAGIAGKLLRVPIVCHLRVSDSEIWLDKILYRLADCFIAVSHTVARRFSSIDNKSKVHVVYNGVDLDTCTMSPRTSEGSCLKIGYFGRIDRRKGIDTLINTAKVLKNDTELLIMGEGDEDYRSELERIAESANVVFRSYKRDIRADMASVDIVALPSHGEGLSRVIIESMAMGKIVVVSDIPGNREAIGEQLERFVYPVGDHDALVEILQGIIKDKSILVKEKGGLRKRAEKCFDVRKNTMHIEAIYDRLIR